MRVKINEHNSVFYATILKDDKAVNGKRMQSKDLNILNKIFKHVVQLIFKYSILQIARKGNNRENLYFSIISFLKIN